MENRWGLRTGHGKWPLQVKQVYKTCPGVVGTRERWWKNSALQRSMAWISVSPALWTNLPSRICLLVNLRRISRPYSVTCFCNISIYSSDVKSSYTALEFKACFLMKESNRLFTVNIIVPSTFDSLPSTVEHGCSCGRTSFTSGWYFLPITAHPGTYPANNLFVKHIQTLPTPLVINHR
jgi:hypothetical protein